MAKYIISQSADGVRLFGPAAEFWRYKGPEVILAGPYETGKTFAAVFKLHALLSKYPNARAVIARQTYRSIVNSVVPTFERKVLPFPPGHAKCAVEKIGGENPQAYVYPNGSRIVLGSLDNPDRMLSAEYDYGFISQAEELPLDSWEKLLGRCSGRAGNVPYPQLMADCNPRGPKHWIRQRAKGPLKLFEQMHEYNPMLFDQTTGALTDQGKRSMAVLDSLTGLRYKRGRLGLWVGQEGMVYEDWNPDVHLIPRFEIPQSWRRFRVIDFGYTNPFVCLWIALDEDDRMFVYREIYMSGRTVREHAETINELSRFELIDATIGDHDAEGRATLAENGIFTIPARKQVSRGIEKVQDRLKKAGDGKPRLYFLRDSLIEIDGSRQERYKTIQTADEFDGYVYPDDRPNKMADENPVKVDDHGMDAIRYLTMYFDDHAGSIGGTTDSQGNPK